MANDLAPAGEAVRPSEPQPSGDSRLAGILARQAAGETLTASERGYLGAVKRRGQPKKTIAAPVANPLLEPVANPENPLFTEPEAAAPVAQIEAGGLVLSAADSLVIQNAAEAILDSMDTTTKLYIGYEARAAGCDPRTVEAYESAVALNPRNRDLMAKNSEPVVLALCKFFNCSPDKLASLLKNSAFMCGLFAHVTAVTATVKSIRESKKERSQTTPNP